MKARKITSKEGTSGQYGGMLCIFCHPAFLGSYITSTSDKFMSAVIYVTLWIKGPAADWPIWYPNINPVAQHFLLSGHYLEDGLWCFSFAGPCDCLEGLSPLWIMLTRCPCFVWSRVVSAIQHEFDAQERAHACGIFTIMLLLAGACGYSLRDNITPEYT